MSDVSTAAVTAPRDRGSLDADQGKALAMAEVGSAICLMSFQTTLSLQAVMCLWSAGGASSDGGNHRAGSGGVAA